MNAEERAAMLAKLDQAMAATKHVIAELDAALAKPVTPKKSGVSYRIWRAWDDFIGWLCLRFEQSERFR